jgi:hypothetical protein
MHTGNLYDALMLGGQGLLAWLDPDAQYLPVGGYEVAHDVGRWWDAVLRLEAATGFAIPPEAETAMFANLQRLTDNPDALLVNDAAYGSRVINRHNLRETIIAYAARVRWRNCAWAREAGHRFLTTLDRCLREDGHFDVSRLGLWGAMPVSEDAMVQEQEEADGWFDATGTSGRCLEGVIWFYEATGDPLALHVADRLAHLHLRLLVDAQGEARTDFFAPDHAGHNHSYLGTVRGLLLYGLLTQQRRFIDAVSHLYRHSITQRNIAESGWTTHDLGQTRVGNDYGEKIYESASAGDVAQLALWLALYDHQTDLLDDVERILRSHLFPVQMQPDDLGPTRPDGRTLIPKWIGGWGCIVDRDLSVWKDSTHDVLAAVVHSLCDIYKHAAVADARGLTLNWHFDYQDERLTVTSRRDDAATLRVELSHPAPLRIRIPAWTPPESVCVTVGGRPLPHLQRIGAHLRLDRELVGTSPVEVRYDLPERITLEPTSPGWAFRIAWRGDTAVTSERIAQ